MGDLVFNLPAELRLPSLYDVRRLHPGGPLITEGRTIGCSMSVPPCQPRFPFVFPVGGTLRRNWRWEEPTAIALALQHAPRCPVCAHGARLWRIESMDAWRCRWGHVIYSEDLDA